MSAVKKLPHWTQDAYWLGWHKALRVAAMTDAKLSRDPGVRQIHVEAARHNNRMVVGYLRLMRGLS
jgi:hypothetical protein